MSQAPKLGTIKPMVMTMDKLHPGNDFKAVGFTENGTTIWEGPVFQGNPFFQDHEPGKPSDNGHDRQPIMDPIHPDQQRWKRAKATGEPITPMWRNRRATKVVRGIMVDFGNGSAGLRPVPESNESLRQRQEAEKQLADFQKEMSLAALQEGVSATDLVKMMLGKHGKADEKPEAKLDDVTYPKWAGRAGWQLSDKSYVERLDDEDKDAYKARAEAAEAALVT